MKPVMEIDLGAKVVRGPDWEYHGQDRGAEYGVIIGVAGPPGWANVRWYTKEGKPLGTNIYRTGAAGAIDLSYYEEVNNETPEEKAYREANELF
jgi:hypothetical protein